MRQAGILMPVASLPSPYGVGDFGIEAYRFAERIRETGFSLWQMLPLNPLGYGNSPYQCYSSKAIDECYISPELLKSEKLISRLPERQTAQSIDYQKAKAIKRAILKEAFTNFKGADDYEEFISQKWARDYAVFITFKEANDNQCWVEWPEEFKNYPQTGDVKLLERYSNDIEFHQFVQYELYHQFNLLKDHLKKLDIEVMGDMPFYVGIDSDDVYYNRQYFQLYDDGRPQWIAGVPPDYFSETGQRWGNPLYDWDYLREHDYDFWFDRIHYSENLYDILRIDHFRAFDTYWKINSREETAVVGEWIINSGEDFFNKYYEKYPDSRIVAEDLGDLRKEVLELRDRFDLMGMHVIEFDFYDTGRKHEIVYVGTHDNEALKTWYDTLEKQEKISARDFIKERYPDFTVYDGILKYCLDMPSDLAVLSAVDIVLSPQRINLPGTIGSPNWEFRLTSFRSLFRRLTKVAGWIKESKR